MANPHLSTKGSPPAGGFPLGLNPDISVLTGEASSWKQSFVMGQGSGKGDEVI